MTLVPLDERPCTATVIAAWLHGESEAGLLPRCAAFPTGRAIVGSAPLGCHVLGVSRCTGSRSVGGNEDDIINGGRSFLFS